MGLVIFRDFVVHLLSLVWLLLPFTRECLNLEEIATKYISSSGSSILLPPLL